MVDHHARTDLESVPPAKQAGNLQYGWDRFAGHGQASEDQKESPCSDSGLFCTSLSKFVRLVAQDVVHQPC